MRPETQGQDNLFDSPEPRPTLDTVEEAPHVKMSVEEAREIVEKEDKQKAIEADIARARIERAEATDREQRGGNPYPEDLRTIRSAHNPATKIKKQLDNRDDQ